MTSSWEVSESDLHAALPRRERHKSTRVVRERSARAIHPGSYRPGPQIRLGISGARQKWKPECPDTFLLRYCPVGQPRSPAGAEVPTVGRCGPEGLENVSLTSECPPLRTPANLQMQRLRR